MRQPLYLGMLSLGLALLAGTALLAGMALVPASAWAQAAPKTMHKVEGMDAVSFTTDDRAKAIVARILQQYGLTANYEVRVVEASRRVPNALAEYYRQPAPRRVLSFNQRYMDIIRARAGNDWSMLGIAAHEVGHLALLHLERPIKPYQAELEADYYAGFTLSKMGAGYDETVSSLRVMPEAGGTLTHPPREERIKAMGRGWNDAQGNVVPDATPPAPETSKELTKFEWKHNRDLFGSDIVAVNNRPGIPGASLEGCAKICNSVPACQGFSYDKWRGWCFLKGGMKPGADGRLSTSVLDAMSILGIKKPGVLPAVSNAQPIFSLVRNRSFPDTPYLSGQAADFDMCKSNCQGDLKCVAFSFVKDKGTCKRFNLTKGHNPDVTADSGYKRQLSTQ
jgi:PAN domain